MAGLYLHVPFCPRKCNYCDFYSLAVSAPPGSGGARAHLEGEVFDRYLEALGIELGALPSRFRPETVFVGGGTPTSLSTPSLHRLLGLVAARIDLSRVTEWTVEANPGTLDGEKAQLLFEKGVSRISLGVQSFERANLALLGRIHTAEEAADGFRLLRRAGFRNIGIDLMYGIPGSSCEALSRDLAAVGQLGCEHLSAYCLTVEEGTPFAALREQGLFEEPSEEEQVAQYALVRETAPRLGLLPYEISNFARPGFECAHNGLYWSGGEYLGCGPSAHSHWEGARFANVSDLDRYCDALLSGRSPRAFEERLEPDRAARETLVIGLRRAAGWDAERFRQATGFDIFDLAGEEIRRFESQGLVCRRNGGIALTERGILLSDTVFAELV